MRAGLLREVITFKELTESKSESGFVCKKYVPVYSCKAYRKKLSAIVGDEMNASEEFIGNTLVFQVRNHPAIKENQRITYNGNDYKILLLDPQTADNTYLITCRKLNA